MVKKKPVRKTKAEREIDKKLKKSAVMIDTQTVDYVCPNNRKIRDSANGGHWYRISTSEKMNVKKPVKCPYCKTPVKMVKYKKEKP